MAQLKLELDYDPELFEIIDNKLTLKISASPSNTLSKVVTIGTNNNYYGLYAHAPKGDNGSSGSGYLPGDGFAGIKVGYGTPYSTSTSASQILQKRIVGSVTIHRTWTSNGFKDTDGYYILDNFRNRLDYVMPGDIIKVNDEFYVITKVTNPATAQNPGNKVALISNIEI